MTNSSLPESASDLTTQTNSLSNIDTPVSATSGPLLHSIDEDKKKMKVNTVRKTNTMLPLIGGALVVVLLGSVSGFGLAKATGGQSNSAEVTNVDPSTGGQVNEEAIKVGTVLGKADKAGDSTDGVLEAGGINGEGSHKLLKPGGPSQTVYLTSSVVNLDQLVGHRVKVWGDTFAAQTAGWLMDVTSVEVVDLDAPRPFED